MTEFTSPSAALDAIGFGRFQWLLLLYTGLGWFADACEVMLLSFLGPSVRCEWGVSAAGESTLSSIVFAGMLCGVYTLGALADGVGRRRGFLASAALLGASGLASALAPSFAWLLVSRGIVGVALGGTPIVVTLFAEFCPSQQRGRWLLLMQSFWTLGTMFEAALAWAVLPPLGWRWLLALSATPLLLLLALYPWLPESPHWLVVQGRYLEAEAVVLRVATANRYRRQMHLDFTWQPGAGDKAQGRGGSPQHFSSVAAGGEEGSGAAVAVGWDRDGGSPAGAAWQEGGVGTGEEGEEHESPHEAEDVGLQAAEWLQEQQAAAAAAAAGHHQRSVKRSRRRLLEGGGGSGGQDGGAAGSAAAAAAAAAAVLVVVEEDGLGGAGARGGEPGALPVRRLLQGMRAAFGQLFGPRLRRTTLLLYCIWFVNAMSYYGLVLLTTALQTSKKEKECTEGGEPDLDDSDFTAILITSMAEAPGLLAAALLVDWCGRKWTLRGLLFCCACCALLLAAGPAGAPHQLLLLFMARAGIEGSFCVLYVYTPELYPTAVRAFGLSLCNCFSRIGGFLAPYATVYLVHQQDSQASELLLGTLCLAAVLAAFFLPFETQGADLHAHDEDGDDVAAACTACRAQPLRGGNAAALGRAGRGRLPGPEGQPPSIERPSLEVETLPEGHPDSPEPKEAGMQGVGGEQQRGRGERDPLLVRRTGVA